MSERMIELQRARLLAAGKGSSTMQPTQNGSQPMRHLQPGQAPNSGSLASRQTPQQAASAALRSEDEQMQRFLERIQQRDDNRADSMTGPTVPTALSRRILQRQGVGYLDDSVAAVASAAADRFIATVLQQSLACRDQRLQGGEIVRQAMRHRKRHIHQYEEDADDRRRRKQEREHKREQTYLSAIEEAEALNKASATKSDKEGEAAPKPKKKKKPDDSQPNGNKAHSGKESNGTDMDDDDESYDSIDEEEEYYQMYYADDDSPDDEVEEEDETLIVRDIARPLDAWDFRISGKVGMELKEAETENLEDAMDDLGDDEELLQAAQYNGEGEPNSSEGNADSQMGDIESKPPSDEKSSTKRSSSPQPNKSSPAK